MCCKDHQEHLADEDRLAYNDGCSFASVKDKKSVRVRACIFRVTLWIKSSFNIIGTQSDQTSCLCGLAHWRGPIVTGTSRQDTQPDPDRL